ncbi:MAG: hypothetical protein NC115_01885 [Bacteroidales bacterium]|nr:hypothetical protein [Bacteroidales bacterium]
MDKDTLNNKCHEAIASLLKMALDINGAPVSDNLLFIKGYEIGVYDDFHLSVKPNVPFDFKK